MESAAEGGDIEKIPIVGLELQRVQTVRHCLDWLQLTWIRVIQQRREGQTASSAVGHCWLAWSLSVKEKSHSPNKHYQLSD